MKHKQKDTDMANEDRKKALEQALGQIEKRSEEHTSELQSH